MSEQRNGTWLSKQTGISLGLALVLFTFVSIGVERVTSMRDSIEGLNTTAAENKAKLEEIRKDMLTRSDVELVVKAQLGEVMREIYELKGRVSVIENGQDD